MDLISLVIILIVLAICIYLFNRYVVPALPAPWGTWLLALLVLIVIVFLLNRFIGLGL